MSPLTEVVHDSSPVVRAAAAGAFGQIGGDRALSALLRLLSDPDELVRETSATALGKLKRTEALPSLRDAVNAEVKERRSSDHWGRHELRVVRLYLAVTGRDENYGL